MKTRHRTNAAALTMALVALVASGCTTEPEDQPTPVPTVAVGGGESGSATASGTPEAGQSSESSPSESKATRGEPSTAGDAPDLPRDADGKITATEAEVQAYIDRYKDKLSDDELDALYASMAHDTIVEHPQSHLDLAVEAAKVMTSWVPAEDYNQTPAEMRAKDLMTPELYDRIEPPQRSYADPAWQRAAREGMMSTPSAYVLDDETGPSIAVRATWSWTPIDSGSEYEGFKDNTERIFYFVIKDVDGKPLITDYTWQDTDPMANFRPDAAGN